MISATPILAVVVYTLWVDLCCATYVDRIHWHFTQTPQTLFDGV
jgi:hypothetical protein